MSQTEDQLAALAFEAEDLINEGELDEARKIGQDLIDAGKEYGFQVMAMADQVEENIDAALKWVEKGMMAHPDSWTLGMTKGNLYSESGKVKDAVLAYNIAARKEGADKSLIEINKAAAYANAQDFDNALNTLQGLKDSDKAIEAFEVKMSLLSDIGQFDMMLEIVEEELAELPVPSDKTQAMIMSEICTHIAKAFWFTDEDEEAIKHYLMQAKEYDRTNSNICWLQREMDPVFSDDSYGYSMIVEGRSQKGVEAIHPESREKILVTRFQNNYIAIADSEEEALEYIYAYESDVIEAGSLTVVEVETIENEEDEPKGLYMLGEMDWMLDAE